MAETPPITYFLQGHAAAEAGQPESANPLLFDAWPFQAWLAGHRFYAEYASARVLQHDSPLERVDVTPHEQGRVAHGKGRPLEACPYEPQSHDWRMWRCGWVERLNELTTEDSGEQHANCGARRLAVIIYAIISVIIYAAIVWAFVALPSARNTGYKACVSKAGNTWVTCKR